MALPTGCLTLRWKSAVRSPINARLLVTYLIFVGMVYSGSYVNATTDTFTAMEDVRKAINNELQAADQLRQYVQKERERLDQLEQLAFEMELHGKVASEKLEELVYHPISYFLLVKYYALDLSNALDRYFASQTASDFIAKLQASLANFPDYQAYRMSGSALLRLQDVYNIPANVFSSGQISSQYSRVSMTGNDCFELGKVAFDNGDHYHGILWFSEALRLIDTEVEKTASKPLVLEFLAYSTYMQGNLHHAYNLTHQWIELEPDNERARNNSRVFVSLIEQAEGQMTPWSEDRQLQNVRFHDDVLLTESYERLCRGETLDKNRESESELTCQYRRHLPMFYICPLKEEVVNVRPRVVVFHDILTDAEILKIQELATPKLQRSTVFATTEEIDNADNSNGVYIRFTQDRTSKSAWLTDSSDPLIARVSRKASALSNLTLDTAEDLQVLNYGIGGHYEPHYDFAQSNVASQFSEDHGNRAATVIFYLNDVDYGGFTVFPSLDVSLPPSKGSCLLWYNLHRNGDGDFDTIHGGCPVLVGTKWVANKWFHIRGQEFSRQCSLNSAE